MVAIATRRCLRRAVLLAEFEMLKEFHALCKAGYPRSMVKRKEQPEIVHRGERGIRRWHDGLGSGTKLYLKISLPLNSPNKTLIRALNRRGARDYISLGTPSRRRRASPAGRCSAASRTQHSHVTKNLDPDEQTVGSRGSHSPQPEQAVSNRTLPPFEQKRVKMSAN